MAKKGNKKVEAPKAEAKGTVESQVAIVGWFKAAYPDHLREDVKNGLVYKAKINGSHRKIVKEPALENKGGVFFGGYLNGVMAKVKGATHHPKSNVYKVGSRITPATAKAVRTAIVDLLGKPACSIDKGLAKDKPVKVVETPVETTT